MKRDFLLVLIIAALVVGIWGGIRHLRAHAWDVVSVVYTGKTPLRRTVVFLLVTALLCVALPAHAAKLHVSWQPVTTNTDGTPITNLSGYRVEWGSCNADGSFGVYQAGINVGASVTSTYIYPTGLNPVCAHVYALNADNELSSASNTASAATPPTLSKPTH
jgi:hypothetical protein